VEYSQENKLDKITLVINTFKDRFHAPMGRFQLELINYFTYFPPSSHRTLEFISCRHFVNTFSTGLVGVEVSSVSWLGETSRPIKNVVLTTKGLQERNTHVSVGTTVKNR
jgi:hypothetical protein